MVKSDKCLFCRMIRGEVKSELVAESNSFFAILDIHPHAKGHTLVIPKKHYVTLLDIPNNLGEEMLKFTKQVASDLMSRKIGDGFNLVMNNLEVAGQVVMHAHIHVIPRNEGDGLRYLTKA